MNMSSHLALWLIFDVTVSLHVESTNHPRKGTVFREPIHPVIKCGLLDLWRVLAFYIK